MHGIARWILPLCRSLLFLIPTSAFNVDPKLCDVIEGTTGSLFGYSVGLLEKNGIRVVVGAPRSASRSYPDSGRPGTVFSCPYLYNATTAARPACEEAINDVDGNNNSGNVTDGWFGAALDVSPDGSILACGHLWKNIVLARRTGVVMVQGRCVEQDHAGALRSYRPMKDRKILKQFPNDGRYMFGQAMGQAGIAVVYLGNDVSSGFLLGSPGLNDGRGGMVIINRVSGIRRRIWSVNDTHGDNEYTGYSVTVGKFWGLHDRYCVAGSPRGASGKGKVYIYVAFGNKVIKEIYGTQFGSFYGATVCAVNHNGDGYDDLLVGAPMFSDKLEEGRVYAYTSRAYEGTFMSSVSVLSGLNQRHSRFGSAISNIGDINSDKIDDVIIGAPYTDSGRGALFIYLGSKRGISEPFSQQILASEISRELRGFGMSFSRSVDVDDNSYPDFVVGAPTSDRAVVCRTRPIATVVSSLSFNTPRVRYDDHNCYYNRTASTCVTITMTLRYYGYRVPDNINIEYRLEADTNPNHKVESGRATFLSTNRKRSMGSLKDQAKLARGETFVMQRRVIIHAKKDVFTDIAFTLSYKITNNTCQGLEKRLCPILSHESSTKITSHVFFTKDCKRHSTCIADLRVKMLHTNSGQAIVLGETTRFKVKVTVTNYGDEAYLTYLYLSYPAFVTTTSVATLQGSVAARCSVTRQFDEPDAHGLTCLIGNPLQTKFASVVLVEFSVDVGKVDANHVTVLANTSTISTGSKLEEHKSAGRVRVNIRRHVVLQTYSVSRPEQLWYGMSDQRTNASQSHTSMKLSQYLHIANSGKSRLPPTSFIVTVPTTLTNGATVYDVTAIYVVYDRQVEKKSECMITKSEITNATISTLKGETYILDCSSTFCVRAVCQLGGVVAGQAFTIVVSGHLYETPLLSFHNQDAIIFRSVVTLRIAETVMLTRDSVNNTSRYYVDTRMFRHRSDTKSVWWPYLLSVILGFVLIAVVILVLNKLGFFRRRKREELRDMVRSRQRYAPQQDANSIEELSAHRNGSDAALMQRKNTQAPESTKLPDKHGADPDTSVHNRLYVNMGPEYHVTAV